MSAETSAGQGDNAGKKPLHVKSRLSISGAPCCPACQAAMPADEHICRYCGFDVRRGQAFKLKHRNPKRWRWLVTLPTLLIKFLMIAILLVVVALAVNAGLDYWGSLRATKKAAPANLMQSPVMCTQCLGRQQVLCDTCNGDGQVDGQIRTKVCSQCQGSGTYTRRLGRGEVKCPFCRGTGKADEYVAQETCPRCQGRGQQPCPLCYGKGVINGGG